MMLQETVSGIRDTSEAILYSLYNALNRFISFLPALIGALLIVVIGWFISGFIANLIERGLKAVGLASAVEKSGIGEFVRRSGTTMTTSGIIAILIKYSIFLIFVQAAANVLGIPQITAITNSIILYIPSVIVAIAIIVIGTFIAQVLAGLVRSSVSELGVGSPNLLAKLTQYAVIGFTIIAAFNQLGIAETVVNTLFFGLVGAIALAVGLAFGLGGREVAAEITQKWYSGTQSMVDAARVKAGNLTGGDAKVYRATPTEEVKQVS
ncbi:hypothetical protein BH20ACI1_BH20ACI1_09110 [soil metagenome]